MKPLLSADMMLLQYIQFGVSKGASLHCAYGGVPLYILTWYNVMYVVIADMFWKWTQRRVMLCEGGSSHVVCGIAKGEHFVLKETLNELVGTFNVHGWLEGICVCLSTTTSPIDIE